MGSVGTRQYLLNSRRREIVKIMADIDKMDNLLLQYWDNLQTKRCFLERNNKVDKSLMRLRKTLMLHIYKNISGNSDIENFISFINEWFFILLGFSVLRQVISVWVWLRCWPCVCGKKGGSGSWISRPWVFPPNRTVQSKKHRRGAASKWGARSARNASNFVSSVLMAEEMATHPKILAWKMRWTEEPGGLPSTGSKRAGPAWAHALLMDVNILHKTSLPWKSFSKHRCCNFYPRNENYPRNLLI